MIRIEELDIRSALEEVRGTIGPLLVKHEHLHEMLREFYDKKDFDSETVIYLLRKINELNKRLDTLDKVRDYLINMYDGIPFQVNMRVGRYMKRFGLTEDQAQLLMDVHNDHWQSMGSEDREKYLLAAARNVEWIEEEKCLHVHFEDAWWLYLSNGSWY